jgi:hypothetical protein
VRLSTRTVPVPLPRADRGLFLGCEVLPRTDNAKCVNRYRDGLFKPETSYSGEIVVVGTSPECSQGDPWSLWCPREPVVTRKLLLAGGPTAETGRRLYSNTITLQQEKTTWGTPRSQRSITVKILPYSIRSFESQSLLVLNLRIVASLVLLQAAPRRSGGG